MAIRVELVSPYGELTGEAVGTPIKNGRRGYTTGEYFGKKPMVLFDRRKIAVPVPQHWVQYVSRAWR